MQDALCYAGCVFIPGMDCLCSSFGVGYRCLAKRFVGHGGIILCRRIDPVSLSNKTRAFARNVYTKVFLLLPEQGKSVIQATVYGPRSVITAPLYRVMAINTWVHRLTSNHVLGHRFLAYRAPLDTPIRLGQGQPRQQLL